MASAPQSSYSSCVAQAGGITMLQTSNEHEANRPLFSLDVNSPKAVADGDFASLLHMEDPVVDRVAEGERSLVRAILEDALHCYQSYIFARDVRGRRLFAEAELWIMRGSPYSAPTKPFFSFDYVCDALAIDPDYIRRCLGEWARSQRAFGAGRKVA
jgi:hypothetical protein